MVGWALVVENLAKLRILGLINRMESTEDNPSVVGRHQQFSLVPWL